MNTEMVGLSVLVLLSGLTILCQAQSSTHTLCASDASYRKPQNSDITVTCGTNSMSLSILLCPVYFVGYNESTMALNGKFQTSACIGTADVNAKPPVLNFTWEISEQAINTCGHSLKIGNQQGTGMFSDYSSIQHVNISGVINSNEPNAGTITYREEVVYQFSCQYPLQYLVNNTELSVSGVSLAVKDNNGSFISTLSMALYADPDFTQPISMPQNGLQLKTRIFVEVKATNLTNRFNVLLDRCYASTSPSPTNSTYYDLFIACDKDPQTVVSLNGLSQKAQFSFEAFRFTEHKNMTVSTFYLHCLTRLCENSTCSSMFPNCNSRRRRQVDVQTSESSDVAMVSSGPILTRVDSGSPTNVEMQATGSSTQNGDVTGVAVAAGFLCAACLGMAAIVAFVVKRRMAHLA